MESPTLFLFEGFLWSQAALCSGNPSGPDSGLVALKASVLTTTTVNFFMVLEMPSMVLNGKNLLQKLIGNAREENSSGH